LIELQGFPTLYGYQYFFERKLKDHFAIPENYTSYFYNVTPDEYVKIMKHVILTDSYPANVILL